MKVNWHGVFPAITTPFNEDLSIDYDYLAEHAAWMVGEGCLGIIPFGSLGEGATLTREEKLRIIEVLAAKLGDSVPIVPMISALGTAEAVQLTRDAEAAGASGFMVLPPYIYSSDWREMKAHIGAVCGATSLQCMLYNNPIAYRTDFLPPQIVEFTQEFPNVDAIKESSADLRRITWLRALLGDRFNILMGVDDIAVEAVDAGAVGWVAGMVNALPAESVRLFDLARQGRKEEAFELYKWFLPLLRLDIGTKFVQMIKLAQQEFGHGSERVRPPRLVLTGAEREETMSVIREGIANRPRLETMA